MHLGGALTATAAIATTELCRRTSTAADGARRRASDCCSCATHGAARVEWRLVGGVAAVGRAARGAQRSIWSSRRTAPSGWHERHARLRRRRCARPRRRLRMRRSRAWRASRRSHATTLRGVSRCRRRRRARWRGRWWLGGGGTGGRALPPRQSTRRLLLHSPQQTAWANDAVGTQDAARRSPSLKRRRRRRRERK